MRWRYSKSSISWSFDAEVRSIPGLNPPLDLLTRGSFDFTPETLVFRFARDRSELRFISMTPSIS